LLILLTYIYIQLSVQWAIEGWYKGLGNTELSPQWPHCSIIPPGIPWPSMLPHRTLNFFSNSQSAGLDSCGSRYNFSTLHKNTLKISCDTQAQITEQPDYISMRDNMFVLTETGFEVYNDTKSLEKAYNVPGE